VELCKKIFLVVMWGALLSATSGANVVDRIVAVVNDDIVTLVEFNAAFAPHLQNIMKEYEGEDREKVIEHTRKVFMQRYIDGILIEQEAKKTVPPIVVKDEEVITVLREIVEKRNLSMEEFLKELAKEGNTLEMAKEEIRGQMLRMRVLNREIKSKILVTEEEIGEYYNKHRDQYEGKEAVHIKEIMLTVPEQAGKAARAKIKENAHNLLRSIKAGESFEEVAAKYSQGGAAKDGGDIGFVERGIIIPELEAVAFGLSVGEVSNVIESENGFYIIKIVDKRGAGIKSLEMVRQEIKAKIENEKMERKYEEWISSVRKKSHIDIRLKE